MQADISYLGSFIGDLKNRIEELDQFFNLNLDLLCIIGFYGVFLKLNQSWATTFGYSLQELMSNQFTSYIHPDDREYTNQQMHNLSKGEVAEGFINRYLCKQFTDRVKKCNNLATFANRCKLIISTHNYQIHNIL